MQKSIGIMLITACMFQCSSTSKNDSEIFLRYYFKEYLEGERIYAMDYIGDHRLTGIIETLSRDTLRQSKTSDVIVLTESERQILIESINSLKERRIDNTFFSGVRVIPQDTLDVVLNKDDFLSWEKFNAKYAHCLHSFSRPVFLRNNTLCFFYSAKYCGQFCCGGTFQIYRKTWLGWEPYLNVYMWLS